MLLAATGMLVWLCPLRGVQDPGHGACGGAARLHVALTWLCSSKACTDHFCSCGIIPTTGGCCLCPSLGACGRTGVLKVPAATAFPSQFAVLCAASFRACRGGHARVRH